MNRPAQVIVGAKLPLRAMHVWAIRVRLQIAKRLRDLALFDIALFRSALQTWRRLACFADGQL